MTRRLVFLSASVAGVVLLVLAARAWWGGRETSRPRPNVLLVSIDSLRADHVGAYGYPRDTTPTIDALARDGVRFSSAISSSSWTLPAHVTMMTGLSHPEHRVGRAKLRLAEDAVTLAEVLHGAGYVTAGFVSGPTVRGLYGLAQGFDTYDESVAQPDRRLSQKGITSPGVTRLVSEWLDGWGRSSPRRPFFLFLHYWDVHYDYEPPAPYDTMFDPHYAGDVTSHDFEKNPRIHPGMPPRDLEHVVALYDGEIRFTDDHLGRVVARLRALSVLDDTIVAVTSDHGDEFFEHGHKGHLQSLHDELIRVPLVIRYPGRVAPARVIEEQVRLTDLAPTLLGLAGVEPPPGFASQVGPEAHRARDLSPWLEAAEPAEPFPDLLALSELTVFSVRQIALRTGRHKLIRYARARDATQLFDLAADPGEERNLYDDPRAAAVRGELETTLDDLLASLAAAKRLHEPTRLDAKQSERLRALGYIQ